MVIKLLVVDDEEDILFLLKDSLSDMGYDVSVSSNRYKAIKIIKQNDINVALIDVWLDSSDKEGLELLKEIKEIKPDLSVVMISGHGGIKAAVESIKIGAYDYIEKPFSEDRIDISIKRAYEAAKMKKKIDFINKKISLDEKLVGTSNYMLGLKERVDELVETNKNIFICGDVGVGKSNFARVIHDATHKKRCNFVLINSEFEGSFVNLKELVDYLKSELGSALEGTIFIDNISSISLNTQRIIKDLIVAFLENEDRKSCRFIISSDIDEKSALLGKKIDKELFDKIDPSVVHMLPISRHKEDIPDLCKHFSDCFFENSGESKKEIDKEIVDLLTSFDWPDNIKQLKNVVYWIITMSYNYNESTITFNNISKDAITSFVSKNQPSQIVWIENLFSIPIKKARKIFEKKYFLYQYERFDCSVSKTAMFVGMERSALYRKLRDLNIIE